MHLIKESQRTRILAIPEKNQVRKEFKPGYEHYCKRVVDFLHSVDRHGFPKVLEHGDNYFTMPSYGKTLKDKDCRLGGLTPDILKQVAEVVFEIHFRRWIHFDVQATNVAIDPAGNATLLDFEHVSRRHYTCPFWKSPDLTNELRKSSWAYWDTPQPFGLKFYTQLDSSFAVDHVRKMLKKELLEVSGPGIKLGDGQPHYSSFDIEGFQISGARDTALRFDRFRIKDLKDKTVLDIGSNTGAFCFEAWKRGSILVLGLETVQARVDVSKRIASFVGTDNVHFNQCFIGKDWEKDKWDVVFACAIDIRVPNPQQLYIHLFDITKEVCFFESNVYKDPDECKKQLKKAGWPNPEFVGRSNDSCGRTNWILRK